MDHEDDKAIQPSPTPHTDDISVVRVRHLRTLLVWGFVIVLGLWFFQSVKLMLLGLLAASAVACTLWPLMQRIRRSRAISAMVVGVGFLAVMASVVAIGVVLLAQPIQREVKRLPETRQQLDAGLAKLSQQFGIDPPIDSAAALAQGGQWLGRTGQAAITVGQTVLAAIVALVLVMIGSVYLLAEPRGDLLNPVLRAVPPTRRTQILAACDELGPKLRWWLIGLLISMSVVSLISWIGYRISGIKFAIPLAVFSGLAEMIPTLGPTLAGAVAVLVASTQGSGPAAGAAITWAVVQILESYVILPLIMRKAVKMPAVVTLFSVILWGEVFGAAGLLLAIPINLLIWVLFKHLVIQPDAREANA